MNDLSIYHNGDYGDMVIARNPEHAQEIYFNLTGNSLESIESDGWVRLDMPVDHLFAITDDDTGEITEKTIAEWIEFYGEGYLCCDY